jgi:hypothetical protein
MNTWIKIVGILIGIKADLHRVLSSIGGWLVNAMIFIAFTFGDDACLVHWILIALAGDLFFGCWQSIKRGTFHISYALQETAIKIVLFVSVFFMPLVIDKIIPADLSYLTIAVAALLVGSEFFSILAHILIIKPDFTGAKLIQRLLEVEVSHKLGIDPNEFRNIFKKK